jgi:hypothetical protein
VKQKVKLADSAPDQNQRPVCARAPLGEAAAALRDDDFLLDFLSI